jgi:ParB/RepB/Spo0J family partition protein
MTTAIDEKDSARNNGNYVELPPDSISPSKLNPRKVFDESAMRELAESLKTHGMIEPIVARNIGDGRLEIICGERRWRAAKLAGLELIPTRILQGIDDRTALEMALTENLARKDINPIEEAEGYRALRDMAGLRITEIAKRVNRDPSTVSNAIRIAEQLPEEIKEKIRCGELTASHGKALIPFAEYPKLLEYKLNQALNGMATKELEKLGSPWELERVGALVELCSGDVGVKAAKDCLKCEHHKKSDRRDGWLCLVVECAAAKRKVWNDVQVAEMTEKMSAETAVSIRDLRHGTYEYLDVAPPGCQKDCESRKIAIGHNGKPGPICVNPECCRKLKSAHSRIIGKERKKSHQETLESAITWTIYERYTADSRIEMIFVSQGIGGKDGEWITVYKSLSGGSHRIKSLPTQPTRFEAQAALDEYAKKKKWKRYGEFDENGEMQLDHMKDHREAAGS